MQDALRLLENVLPEEGRYCALTIGARKRTYFFTDKRNLAEFILREDKLNDESTPYFTCCTMQEQARDERKAEFTHLFKELRADVDARPGATKGYETKEEAWRDIWRVVAELDLPRPWIVDSGHGYHLHWPLDKAIPREEWTGYAHTLVERFNKHKLKCDIACTKNPVQVLRLPGTIHRGKWRDGKRDEPGHWEASDPVPVRLILDGDPPQPLSRFPNTAVVIPISGSVADPDRSPNCAAAWKATALPWEPMMAEDGCKQLHWCFQHAQNLPEPMFAWACGVFSESIDGYAWAKWLAEQDHTQQQGRLDDRYKRRVYWSCAHAQQLNSGVCEGCRKFKAPKFFKPLDFATCDGVPTQPPGPMEIDCPVPNHLFELGPDGEIFHKYFNSQGKEVKRLVSPYPTFMSDYTKGQFYERHSITINQRLNEEWVKTVISVEQALSPEGQRKLMGRGVKLMDDFQDFTKAWVNKLTKARHAYDQMGWCDNDTAFIWGHKKITATSAEDVLVTDSLKPFADRCVARGRLNDWLIVMESMNPHLHGGERALHAFVFFCGFASILLKFRLNDDEGGLIVHSSSNSPGTGKSTAGYAGVGVWGQPTGMTFSRSDTVNSRPDRYLRHRHLPIGGDEFISREENEVIRDITTHMAAKPKSVTKDSNTGETLQREGEWHLLLLSCANKAISTALRKSKDGQALLTRVIDLRFPEKPIRGEATIHRLVQENYGVAAVPFVQALLRKGAEGIVADLKARERVIAKFYHNRNLDERFQIPLLAAVTLAMQITEELGWHAKWDAELILTPVVEMIDEQRDVGYVGTALDVLNEWISLNRKHVRTSNAQFDMKDPCFARVIGDHLFINRKKLQHWVAECNMFWKSFVRELNEKRLVYREKSQRQICWMDDESFSSATTECISFPIAALKMGEGEPTPASGGTVVPLSARAPRGGAPKAPGEEHQLPSPGNFPRRP